MARLRKNKNEETETIGVEIAGEEAEVVIAKEELDELLSNDEKVETIDVIDNAVATAKSVEVKDAPVSKEPNVRINPKQDIRTYIGDQWYNLKAGKVVSVPKTVKDKLQKAGLLNAI